MKHGRIIGILKIDPVANFGMHTPCADELINNKFVNFKNMILKHDFNLQLCSIISILIYRKVCFVFSNK